LIQKFGFSKHVTFDRSHILKNQKLMTLYSELIPEVERISKKEYELLIKYIDQNDLKGKFSIVDIGWSGGMQRYLEQTLTKLEIPHEISGYYTGVSAYYTRNAEVVPDFDISGYLFDFKNDTNAIDKRSCFVGLFETLFLEQGGSVKNYVLKDDKVVANRYEYEYFINGQPTDEYLKVQKIQNSAMLFVNVASKDETLNLFKYSADDMFNVIRKIGANPNKDDINLFADFSFFDEGETHKLANPKSIAHYALHIREFKKDFLMCRWKTGFIKRILRIKLPYEKMYNLMLRYK